MERIRDHPRGKDLFDREVLVPVHRIGVHPRPLAQRDADRCHVFRRRSAVVHVTLGDERADRVELQPDDLLPFGGNAVLAERVDHVGEIARAPALAMQDENGSGMARGDQARRGAHRIVAGRAPGMNHQARLGVAMDTELLDHSRKDQIGLIIEAVKIWDEQDRVDIGGGHPGIVERKDRNARQIADEIAIGVAPGGNFADTDEQRVVRLSRIDIEWPIVAHSRPPVRRRRASIYCWNIITSSSR